jgi:hypothetical protein
MVCKVHRRSLQWLSDTRAPRLIECNVRHTEVYPLVINEFAYDKQIDILHGFDSELSLAFNEVPDRRVIH